MLYEGNGQISLLLGGHNRHHERDSRNKATIYSHEWRALPSAWPQGMIFLWDSFVARDPQNNYWFLFFYLFFSCFGKDVLRLMSVCLGFDQVTPLPVWHGPGYRSLGFRIGDVCYIRCMPRPFQPNFQSVVFWCNIQPSCKLMLKGVTSSCSDASEIPAETYPLLENCDLLILVAFVSFAGPNLVMYACRMWTCIKKHQNPGYVCYVSKRDCDSILSWKQACM